MTGKGKETLNAIMRALELEKETFEFYTVAEQKTIHPEGKRIFRWLAKTEEEHYLRLKELYASLNEGGSWLSYAGTSLRLEPEGADFTGFQADDREALEIAMGIERKGIDFFDELAARIRDPDGKRMLETLRDEEKEHLRVIEAQSRVIAG